MELTSSLARMNAEPGPLPEGAARAGHLAVSGVRQSLSIEVTNPAARRAAAGFGPRGRLVEALMERVRTLTRPEIELLGEASGRVCHGQAYAEALLALRRAADSSGRAREAGRAAGQATMLIVDIAAARCPRRLEDRARWQTIAEQATWGAADAARALIVGDLLSEKHLRVLTHAWDDCHATPAALPR